MAKHLDIVIEEDRLSFSRRQDQIVAKAALDGIYVIRVPVCPCLAPVDAARHGLADVDPHDWAGHRRYSYVIVNS